MEKFWKSVIIWWS